MNRTELYRFERAKGRTYRDIADEYNVSWQAVYGACHRKKASKRPNVCRWERLADWMEDNDVSIRDLSKKLKVTYSTMYNWLAGTNKIPFEFARELRQLTGINYDELFAE